jgi:pilus assembly protein Flp/PilA
MGDDMKKQSDVSHPSKLLRRFVRDECATTAIEYALIASVLSIAIVGAATQLGSTLKDDYFGKVAEALEAPPSN